MGATKALALCVGVLLAWPATSEEAQLSPLKGQASATAGAREQLNIVSTTQDVDVAELLADFRALHPNIETVHTKINSNDIYSQIVDPSTSSAAPGDIVWSSAMDLQIKLVNDGYAQPYVSKEIAHIPDWAIWKDEAYAITAEPIVIVYNKKLVAEFRCSANPRGPEKPFKPKARHLSRQDRILRSGAERDRIPVHHARCLDHQDDVGYWSVRLAALVLSSTRPPERCLIGFHPANI